MDDKVTKRRTLIGEANPASKLTEEKAILIFRDTRSYRKISAAFGVSTDVVGKIKRRQLWRHVDVAA